MIETVMKNFFLYLSKSRILNKAAKKWGLRFGARRFVAGETIEDAIEIVRELNQKGIVAVVDRLGEFINDESEAIESAEHCLKTLRAIKESGVDSQLSVKMTSLGLDISHDLCMTNMRNILNVAKECGVFVCIDMEDYSHCQVSIDIFKELRQEFDNVGLVLQAYLYRTAEDIEALKEFNPVFRLVKGAYKESPEVAYPEKNDVDENFKKLIAQHLNNGNFTAVATHDDQIINFTKEYVREHNISNDLFEFQMLYGIRVQSQLDLANEGYKMRVYVAYGNDWYGYYMRRLAERPANVAFILKGMFKK